MSPGQIVSDGSTISSTLSQVIADLAGDERISCMASLGDSDATLLIRGLLSGFEITV